MQDYIKIAGAALSAGICYMFGGCDVLLSILLAFIVIDYVSGLIGAMVTGTMNSRVGFRGIAKKALILCVVAVAHLGGQATGIAEIRSMVIGFYIANEGISILENAGKIGVPLPKKLMEVLEQLKEDETNAADRIQQNETNSEDSVHRHS